ncbi:D-beta-hydroxybutyrate dehydrogenase [Sarcoptes scabiei]|nr:D-beta-hydroxybutyrate dehydrogenase [Sarcoptes scabiei]
MIVSDNNNNSNNKICDSSLLRIAHLSTLILSMVVFNADELVAWIACCRRILLLTHRDITCSRTCVVCNPQCEMNLTSSLHLSHHNWWRLLKKLNFEIISIDLLDDQI